MAELAVLLAIKKIGNAVTAEAQRQITSKISSEIELITQLPSSMKRIQREFVVMQAFLSNIDSYKHDNALQAWLQELRKIANDVEDIVDKIVFLLGDHQLNGSGLFKKLTSRSKNLLDWRSIGLKLKELEIDLQHVTQIKERWVRIEETHKSDAYITEMQLAAPFLGVNNDELVGIEENERKLMEMLQAEEKDGEMIVVWGQPGVGKTTLFSCVFNKVKRKYDLCAFVQVLYNDGSDELLASLIKKLPQNDDSQSLGDSSTRSEHLKRKLGNKKFLVVLDDVPETLDSHIRVSLTSGAPGSKVIVTTQFQGVAHLVREKFRLEVKSLTDDKAMDLLIKHAFSIEKLSECPSALMRPAQKIIKQCGGLPVAVVSIGGLLSQQEKSRSEWEKVSNELQWLLANNKRLSHPKTVLELSLKRLPKYLKNCYLLCSSFPKNYVFNRGKLIRLWIAEGFIERRGSSSLEEVAEDYLKELVNRCVFHVIEKGAYGRVKKFRVHSFMQETLMLISREEHFSMLCTDLEKLNRNDQVRHLLLHNCSERLGSNIDMPQLRSFMVRKGAISAQMVSSVLSHSHYLMVLDLQRTGIDNIPDNIGDLFNLHLLNLRKTKIKKLPRTIGRLTKLQTLDIAFTDVTELPKEIRRLKNLRHLFVGNLLDPSKVSFDFLQSVKPPGRFRGLKFLQTIHGIEASDDFVKDIEELTCLRSLRISKAKHGHAKDLFFSLEKCSGLFKLNITTPNKEEQLNLTGVEALTSVRTLELHGRLVQQTALSCIQSLRRLTSLYLGWTGLAAENIMLLGNLECLESLKLNNALEGDFLTFTAGKFSNLKMLCMRHMATLKRFPEAWKSYGP